MIATQLIIAAFFIARIYQLKSVKELPKWITVFFTVALIITTIDDSFRDIRKMEALEKLATEISKNKPDEK